MPTLKEVLNEDFGGAINFTKGLAKGFVQGSYAYFAFPTTNRKIKDIGSRLKDYSCAEICGRFTGLISGAVTVPIYLLTQCLDKNIHPKYLLSAMVLTNLADYGYSVYRRVKGLDKKQ